MLTYLSYNHSCVSANNSYLHRCSFSQHIRFVLISLKSAPTLLSLFPIFTIITFALVIFHYVPLFNTIRISTDAHPAEVLAGDIFKFRLPYKQFLKKNCYLCTFKDRLITFGDSVGKHRFSCLRQRKSAPDAGFRGSLT